MQAGPPREQVDFFISHAGKDRAWAEWVAWQLQDAGHTVAIDVWDWAPGDNFVERMADALDHALRMIALFSAAYFTNEYSRMELTAWIARPGGTQRLVPLRVEDFEPPVLYRPYLRADLFGVDPEVARTVLLSAIAAPGPPSDIPPAPTGGQRSPGSLPPVWNMLARNPQFTGRDELLLTVRSRLLAGERTVVQALHGWGGVGKTQLAIEYAYRYAGEYDLVWWIDAEVAELVGEQVAALAVAAGLAPAGGRIPDAVAAIHRYLRHRDRWLLIFDNVQHPSDLTGWLPAGPGHGLMTSREQRWEGVAEVVTVDVFTRAESTRLLVQQVPALTEADADALAADMGDLPLAVAQAAGVLATSGMPVDLYRQTLATHARHTLEHGAPSSYPTPLAASVTMSLSRLHSVDPAALELMQVCAFLAPEPLPLDLFTGAPRGSLPAALGEAATSPMLLYEYIAAAGRVGLARSCFPDGPVLHRLTQAVIVDTLSDAQRQQFRTCAEAVIVAAMPDDGDDPKHWSRWDQLMPHLFALDPATSTNGDLRWMANSGVWHLIARGDSRSAQPLAERLLSSWRTRLGDQHPNTLSAVNNVARVRAAVGEHRRARELDEQTLAARRRVLGDEHPNTLISAFNLARDLYALGEYGHAQELDEQTLAARRRVLGEEHADTLTSAVSLARDVYSLGHYEQARQMHGQTLATSRRALGDDHPHTLLCANDLADDLYALGQLERARELHAETLTISQRVLGDDHPDTLVCARGLALDLHALDRHTEAHHIEAAILQARARRAGDPEWEAA